MTAPVKTRTRKAPKDRKAEVLEGAIAAAVKHGWATCTRQDVADAAGVSPALVNHYLGDMAATRRAVMREAVRRGLARIVAEGLVLRDKVALKAPEELKAAARQAL